VGPNCTLIDSHVAPGAALTALSALNLALLVG
jgi:hypothetical protein